MLPDMLNVPEEGGLHNTDMNRVFFFNVAEPEPHLI